MSKEIGDGMEHVLALAAIGKRPTGFVGEERAAAGLVVVDPTRPRAWHLIYGAGPAPG